MISELEQQAKLDRYISTAFKNANIAQQTPIEQTIRIDDIDLDLDDDKKRKEIIEPLRLQLELAKSNLQGVSNDIPSILSYLSKNESDLNYFNKYITSFKRIIPQSGVSSGQFISLLNKFKASDIGRKVEIPSTTIIQSEKPVKMTIKGYESLSNEDLDKLFRQVFIKKENRLPEEGDYITYITTEGKRSQPSKISNVKGIIYIQSTNMSNNNNRKIRYIIEELNPEITFNSKTKINWRGQGSSSSSDIKPQVVPTEGSGLIFKKKTFLKKNSDLFR
jgi:hypothetical protein